jgi:hypothetical protein
MPHVRPRPSMCVLLLAFSAACAPEAAPVQEVAADPYVPAPYIVEEAEEGPVASFSEADLEAAITDALSAALGLTAAPVFASYAQVMDNEDSGCPNYYDYGDNTYWYDQCTAEDGTSFQGYSFYYRYVDFYSEGLLYNGDSLYGVARVADADGNVFEAGGSASNLRGEAEGYTYFQSVVQGSFSWTGPEAEGTWMTEDLAPDVNMYGILASAYDARAFYLDGGVSGLGGVFETVVMEDVFMMDGILGGICPTEPGGLISARDDDGNWYDVVLDGMIDAEDTPDPQFCDGCGTAYFRGEEIGSVCIDFSVLVGWGDSPW